MATPSRSSKRVTTTPESSQRQKFIRTARELGCDEDLEAFKQIVKKLAKAPPPRPRKRKPRENNEAS